MGYGMIQVFSVAEFLKLMSCSIFHGRLLPQSQFIMLYIHVVWGIDDRIQVRIRMPMKSSSFDQIWAIATLLFGGYTNT